MFRQKTINIHKDGDIVVGTDCTGIVGYGVPLQTVFALEAHVESHLVSQQ